MNALRYKTYVTVELILCITKMGCITKDMNYKVYFMLKGYYK